jgi:hypothetical protein
MGRGISSTDYIHRETHDASIQVFHTNKDIIPLTFLAWLDSSLASFEIAVLSIFLSKD